MVLLLIFMLMLHYSACVLFLPQDHLPSFTIHSSQAFVWLFFLYHTVCLDDLTDAFEGGTCYMASSLAACLYSVGLETRRDTVHDVVPLLGVDGL